MIQSLISSGHSYGEIRGYTIAQVSAFMRAIERAARLRRAAQAADLRMAQAEGSAWKKYFRGLTD